MIIEIKTFRCLVVFLISVLILLISRSSALFSPEFFREDLWIFYAQHHSLHAFIESYNGYYHLLPRIIAFLVSSPAEYAWISFIITCLVFVNLFSSRIKLPEYTKYAFVISLALVSFVYSEILFSIGYLQWPLCVALITLLLKEKPITKGQIVEDNLLVVFVGLSSIFVLVLFLFLIKKEYLWYSVIITCAIQCSSILTILSHSNYPIDIFHYLYLIPYRTIGQLLDLHSIGIANILYYGILIILIYFGNKRVYMFLIIHFLFLIALLPRLSENFFQMDWFGGGDRYFFVPSLMLMWGMIICLNTYLFKKPNK
jgi:hypothetical protein